MYDDYNHHVLMPKPFARQEGPPNFANCIGETRPGRGSFHMLEALMRTRAKPH